MVGNAIKIYNWLCILSTYWRNQNLLRIHPEQSKRDLLPWIRNIYRHLVGGPVFRPNRRWDHCTSVDSYRFVRLLLEGIVYGEALFLGSRGRSPRWGTGCAQTRIARHISFGLGRKQCECYFEFLKRNINGVYTKAGGAQFSSVLLATESIFHK